MLKLKLYNFVKILSTAVTENELTKLHTYTYILYDSTPSALTIVQWRDDLWCDYVVFKQDCFVTITLVD